MIEQVCDEQAARALAAALNAEGRATPVAVVTVPSGRDAPLIDVDRLHDEVADLVSVHVITTAALTWVFAAEMPPGTEVYGGAGRVYPADLAWVHDPSTAPLRLAFSPAEGRRATEALVGDALGAAFAAGLVSAHVPMTAQVARGEVLGMTAGRGVVLLSDGRHASIAPELTVPGVPLERIVSPGMPVEGVVDDAGRIDIRALIRPPSAIPYAVGDVVLARVEAVGAETAQLAVHPALTVAVNREAVTSNPRDSVDSLMSQGEVLRARVVATAPWSLELHDLDDDEEATTAIALIEGGPPWLVEGVPLPEEEDEPEEAEPQGLPAAVRTPPRQAGAASPSSRRVPAPRQTAPTPALLDPARRERDPTAPQPDEQTTPSRVPSAAPAAQTARLEAAERTIARLEAEAAEARRAADVVITGLRAELRLLRTERTRVDNQAKHARDELARAKKKLRAATSKQPPRREAPGTLFSEPEAQFDHELYLAWATRIPSGEKHERPMCGYQLGPDFLSTVRSIQGVSRAKILDVVVEVLTGIASDQPGRQVHQLRVSEQGGSAQRVRPDGAKAWRVALQEHTPGARRLHFWRLTDGTVELARVVTHDDFRA